MKIPESDVAGGRPTVSATQLRAFGAGGFRLSSQEEAKGCPRLYKARYVDHSVPRDEGVSFELEYGRTVHEALTLMEAESLSPEEALDRVFPATMTPDAWVEARDDLNRYMERGASPVDRFATIATEVELAAPLYEDPEFGVVWYRGFVDWLGIDPEDPSTVHLVDYKTNRQPPSEEDLRGDVQMRGYDFLIRASRERLGLGDGPVRVVTHLDAIKYREVVCSYTDDEIDAWVGWASAVVRTMLRDEEGKPRLNPGCAWCPIRSSCPAYESLPEVAARISSLKPEPDAADDDRLVWRDQANKMRLLLEKAVKEIDQEFDGRALARGGLETRDVAFRVVTNWRSEPDVRMLHEVLGDRLFYQVARVSRTAVNSVVKDWSASDRAPVDAAWVRVPAGVKVRKEARE